MKRIILREDKLDKIFDGEDVVYDKLTDQGKEVVDNLKLAIGRYYTLLGRGIPQEPYGKLWVDYLNPLREKLMGL